VNAASKSDSRISVEDLVLPVTESYDPNVFALEAYDDFIEGIVGNRDYSRDAIRKTLIFLCSSQYGSTADLAEQGFASAARLEDAYGTVDTLLNRLPFPDKLACSIDLATGTGKSYAMFAIARIMLNEGLVSRVLVLCPSLTIETGLNQKFEDLLADSDLTSLLPERSGTRLPGLVDASETVREGQICIENIHAAYERTGSSIRDSFVGQGARTLVLSDEAHHIYSPGADKHLKKWHEFIVDPDFGFKYHVGLSGTCYIGDEYFVDVIHRYSIRDAIDDRWVKDVYYVEKDNSKSDDQRFQKLVAQHEKNRKTYKQVKPITIAVTKTIQAAKRLREDLVGFLATKVSGGKAEAEDRVLIVTSAAEHEKNLLTLTTVDEKTNPVEWIVSVSMLTEGWDVKNVFQIYPHEARAFNSRLLIAQVLGRGLRRPDGIDQDPRVFVFNHSKWGPEVDGLVSAVIDRETTIAQRVTDARQVKHFELHRLTYKAVPTKLKAQKLDKPKEIRTLSLSPQLDAPEATDFISVGRGSRETLITRIEQTYYPVSEVVSEVRERILNHDSQTNGSLAKAYPKAKVEKLIRQGLKAIKENQDRVSHENRQRILSAFGSLQQKRTRPGAEWAQAPDGMATLSTATMGPVSARISGLTGDLALFYDEKSEELVEDSDAAALKKAKELDASTPTRLERISNSYLFKSPVTVVLGSHTPEREFIRKLYEDQNAKAVEAWVKSPDVGFFDIEFGYDRNGRRKQGRFNPDFFINLAGSDEVVVVETKADDDVSEINRGKALAADAYFNDLNTLLKKAKSKRAYQFHFLSPDDYEKFFEALRQGKLGGFRSTLHADLTK
jgi:type III restriction enzyme